MSRHLGSAALLAFSLTIFPVAAVLASPPAHTPAHARIDADAVYYNGKVITMEAGGESRIVQAFAVKDGRFVAVGSNGEAMRYRGPGTRASSTPRRPTTPWCWCAAATASS